MLIGTSLNERDTAVAATRMGAIEDELMKSGVTLDRD